jgi:hypothetical protein
MHRGGGADVDVGGEDSDELDEDKFASSCEESDAAEEVAAARADRSTGHALCQIAFGGARRYRYYFLKGRRYERTGPTIVNTFVSQLRGECQITTLDQVSSSMYYKVSEKIECQRGTAGMVLI